MAWTKKSIVRKAFFTVAKAAFHRRVVSDVHRAMTLTPMLSARGWTLRRAQAQLRQPAAGYNPAPRARAQSWTVLRSRRFNIPIGR